MTMTGRHVGFFFGAAMLVLAATMGANAQNSSAGQASPVAQGDPGFGRGPGGGPRGRGPMGPEGPADLPLGRLDLSPQQQDQVKTIMESHRDELIGLADREAAARRALDASISADTIDENAIRGRAADLAAVEADMAVSRAHIRAEVFQVLTPDQQKLAKTLQAQMQAGRPGRPGPGRGR